MSERLSNRVLDLGLKTEAVVVGSGPLDGVVRTSHDLNLAVEESTYRGLRRLHDWEEMRSADGRPMLTRDGVEIAVGWGGATTQELRERGYVEGGVHYAGLPDVYAWKQESGRDKDTDDLGLIRSRLYDRPLPPAMVHRELAFIEAVKPADLPDHVALRVAANGLYIVRTIFGDHTHRVHTYSGSIETGDVVAAYHDFWHSANGAERISQHITKVNQGRLAVGQSVLFTPADAYASIAGFSYHDSYMGDGRRSANPDGFDELRAARMVARHLELSGATEDHLPHKSYTGVLATAFNEQTKTQDIDPARGNEHIQAALAGTDLGTFAEPTFALETLNLTIEDLTRVGAGFDRPLDRKSKELGIRITSIPQALAIIDNDPALRSDFAKRLAGSAAFCKSYNYTQQWTLDRPTLRAANAGFMKELAEAIQNGRVNASQAYAQAAAFTRRIRSVYGGHVA